MLALDVAQDDDPGTGALIATAVILILLALVLVLLVQFVRRRSGRPPQQ
jgi:hypothetical protein